MKKTKDVTDTTLFEEIIKQNKVSFELFQSKQPLIDQSLLKNINETFRKMPELTESIGKVVIPTVDYSGRI